MSRSLLIALFLAPALFWAQPGWGQTYFSQYFAADGRVYRTGVHCSLELLNTTVDRSFLDIAAMPNGRLFGYLYGEDDEDQNGFFEIDTLTGALTTTCPLTSIVNNLEAESDSTLLFMIGPVLYRMHVQTCSIVDIGNIGYEAYGDLLLIDDMLYLAAMDDILVGIELSPDHESVDAVTEIGVMDVFPGWAWGLALPAGFQQTYPDCILVVASLRVFAANINTAATEEICLPISSGSLDGATTRRKRDTDTSIGMQDVHARELIIDVSTGTVSGLVPGETLALHNVLGQQLGAWPAQGSTLVVPLITVSAGPLLISVRDPDGRLVLAQRVVNVQS